VLVAALMESLAAGVATAQDEEVCRGERKVRRRREKESRWLLSGRLVVVLTACGGAGGRGRNGGSVGCLWRRKKEKDAEEENLQRGFGFVGRLRRRLLVEEECFCGVFKG